MDIVTRLVHAGQATDTAYRSITPPIYQTSNFRFSEVGSAGEFEYSRIGNPTRKALEAALADLEGGVGAVATASGMAAITTALAIFDSNSHVICTHDCYGGTIRLLNWMQEQGKLEVSYVNLSEENAVNRAKKANTRLVWVETPSNPLLSIIDIQKIVNSALESELTVIADNTFLSPYFQQPISYGVDIVVHSTTKYLNGHADVVGGAIISRTEELNQRIQHAAMVLGTIAAPFDCWLVLRGMRTLPLRMRQHESNAMAIAHFLETHPKVEKVYYPGLKSHTGHELAARQQAGHGGMVAFAMRGGLAAANKVLARTKVFALAESLGGVDSLIGHPVTMSHATIRPAQRLSAGITDNIIRLSVGIEAQADLLADLEQALTFDHP